MGIINAHFEVVNFWEMIETLSVQRNIADAMKSCPGYRNFLEAGSIL